MIFKTSKQMKHSTKIINLAVDKQQNRFEQNLSDVSKGNVIGLAFYVDGTYPNETINIRLKDDKGTDITDWTHIKELERSKGANDFLSSLRPVNFKTKDVTIEITANSPLTSEFNGQIQFYFDEDYNGNTIKPQHAFKQSSTSCSN